MQQMYAGPKAERVQVICETKSKPHKNQNRTPNVALENDLGGFSKFYQGSTTSNVMYFNRVL